MEPTPLTVLHKIFGYTSFRLNQDEVINHVLQGKNALVLMPTGGGKSLCYQIPSLVKEGTGVVVTPLIALMQDQVSALQLLGVKAEFLNSSMEADEIRQTEDRLLNGELDILYIAPERLTQQRTLSLLKNIQINLFAIDEAHCVSQWGHNFRPSYLDLSVLEAFENVPRLALTATADEHTREDIIKRLNLNPCRRFIGGFDRPNIRYRIALKTDPKKQLKSFLTSKQEECGIIYCLSRKKAEDTAAWLKKEGFNALPYHAGLPAAQRQKNQEHFLKDESVIVVATIAFGMGIDRPDVRFVAHLDIPGSIEAYYQETGRCGRDGLPAEAWMIYGMKDIVMRRDMVEKAGSPEAHRLVEHNKLNALINLCETTACRRRLLLNYFGQDTSKDCGNCDACLSPVETWDGTVAAQKALSCVYRTDQIFGMGHLIKVLTGKDDERIRRFNHDQLKTFGAGEDIDQVTWRSVFRQLVASGLLRVDAEHGSFKLTPASRRVLFEGEQVQFRKEKREVYRTSGQRPDSRASELKSLKVSDKDNELWEALRRCRRQLASEQGVPPYVIFKETTLMDMLKQRPSDLESFAMLNGVGDAKLKKYGQKFLEIIQSAG